MTPTIQTISSKKLIGKHIAMSFVANKTFELWSSFMPQRKLIANAVDSQHMYSLQLYGKDFYTNFNPAREFEKWAALEVANFDAVPEGMETLIIPGGQYAVFHYKGAHTNGFDVFSYIFGEWLPASGYELDDRPHFEILGPKYKNGDPDSEEEIWIPIK
ncbi:AraC family transcriptional regulator [Flavobacterium psychrophilum]|nr:AraC family transcriptional regulator [Flavobacterium psychrophilum]AOE51188.1 AraC family transcriptional regulator [Flavobacterium psychrophilum]